MITREEAQAKFREYPDAQGPHDEVYTDGSKVDERAGAASVINRHFPEWWDDLPPAVQKTPK